jgi:cell division protein FtsL
MKAWSPRARVACVVLLFAAVCTAGLFQVSRRRALVQIGYELARVMTELRRLEEEERRLDLELNLLTAPGRIERVASELGMIRPSPAAIRVVGNRAASLARAPGSERTRAPVSERSERNALPLMVVLP